MQDQLEISMMGSVNVAVLLEESFFFGQILKSGCLSPSPLMKKTKNKIFSKIKFMQYQVVIILLLVSLFMCAGGASSENSTYYIDASNGNDSNPGTSEITAWQTIHNVNSTDFGPGDSILFRRGDKFRGRIRIQSGLEDQKITYGAYGTGPDPIIDGSIIIDNLNSAGWQPVDSNILVIQPERPLSQLFVNGEKQPNGRYPNQGYLSIDADSSALHVIDNDLTQADDYWNGADVFIRSIAWHIDKRRVTDYIGANHQLVLNEATKYAGREGYGYYLANTLHVIDQEGEWAYDEAGNTLYYWPPSSLDRSTAIVETGVEDYGFEARSIAHVAIEGLDIRRYGQAAIYSKVARDVDIRNNEISYSMKDGVFFGGWGDFSERLTIENNNISDMYHDAIVLMRATDSNVRGNTISNVATKRGVQFQEVSHSTIENNDIENIGYCGIGLYGDGNAILIRRNNINNTCLALDDGGGIYISQNQGDNNITVEQNIVTNVIGNIEGKRNDFTEAQGIYIDSWMEDVLVRDNVVVNVDRGIFIHNSNTNVVRDNTIFGAREIGIALIHNVAGREDWLVHSNVVEDNDVLSFSSVSCVTLGNNFEGLRVDDYVTFENNTYIHPFARATVRRYYRQEGQRINEFLSLPEWQAMSGFDRNSRVIEGPENKSGYDILINYNDSPQTFQLPGSGSYRNLSGDVLFRSTTLDSRGGEIIYATSIPPVPPPAGLKVQTISNP